MSLVAEYLTRNRDRHLEELKTLLRIPSVSTDPARANDVRRAAEWVRDRLSTAGCTTVEIRDTKRHPVVYGEWLGAPGRPTVLVYGHYDVQPVDPLNLWETPPFEPTIRDGRLYARGASDDKGQFLIHIDALEAHLQANGTCPVNMKFVIEGEEEIGSPNLEAYLVQERERLAADAVVISDTAMFAKGLPTICYGLRGLAYMEITVEGTDRDLHSGTFGGSVVNPAMALAKLLAALKDDRGRVTVPGFYDRVHKLTRSERRGFEALPHSDRKWAKAIGAPALFGEEGFSTLERLWARPTLEINGIWGGFTGEGAKTVIPAKAHAKVSMRLVPDQRPAEIGRLFAKHVKKLAPSSVRVTVRELHGGDPWVAPTDHPALRAAARALERTWGRKPVFVREGGSIPVVATFERLLRVPTVLFGIGLNEDNLHAPNEKLDLDQHFSGIEAAAALLDELGESRESVTPPKKRSGKKAKPEKKKRPARARSKR